MESYEFYRGFILQTIENMYKPSEDQQRLMALRDILTEYGCSNKLITALNRGGILNIEQFMNSDIEELVSLNRVGTTSLLKLQEIKAEIESVISKEIHMKYHKKGSRA